MATAWIDAWSDRVSQHLATRTWSTAFLTMDAAPDDFVTDGIIKLGIEIATKQYEGPETPFAYDSAPTTFEINAFVW
jgi:hypothetical protein